jgi:homoserine dehydrogenase
VSASLRADLALIGFGNVAQRFVSLIEECRERLACEYALECRIVGAATRRKGVLFDSRGLDRSRLMGPWAAASSPMSGALQLIDELRESDADLRVVVETTTLDIAAGRPAIDHVRAGLSAGCHVITANKGPVAFAYAALRDQARAAGVQFLFEGAVMDGVPVFNLVREALPAATVSGFRGVVNSTTNHVLTALERGERFEAAVARMQAEGIAEADPSLDLDGWDAAAKTAALANVLLGANLTPHSVRRTGIQPSDGERARQVRAEGRRLKLVASASRTGSGVVAAVVEPRVLEGSDLLASLDGKANALVLQTDVLGEIAICQLEGSLTHTAYALLSDLVTLRRREVPLAAPVRRIP